MRLLLEAVMLVLVVAGIVLAIAAIISGKNPVITEFEARQRGLPIPETTPEEREIAKKRSEASTRDAVKLFVITFAILVIATVALYWYDRSLLVYLLPFYGALGVLFWFVMMWFDEQRVKARYYDRRIER
jgi:hypothetical protein